MKKNKLSPLDELRKEKAMLKAECSEREEDLGKYWSFINNNLGFLLLDGAISTLKQKLGLSPSKREESKHAFAGEDDESPQGGGMMHTIKTGLQMTYPLIWEIAQPYIWDFVMGRIKSLFSPKKKKKKRKPKDCDDED